VRLDPSLADAGCKIEALWEKRRTDKDLYKRAMEQVWRMYLFLCTPFNQKRAARMHSISTHTSMLMWRVSSLLWNNLWRRIMIAKFRNWRVAWLPEKSSARCSASFRRDDKAHINQTRLSQIILVWDDDVYLARPSTKPKHLVPVFPLDPSSVRSIACKSCMKKTSCTRVMNCCAVARFVLVIHTYTSFSSTLCTCEFHQMPFAFFNRLLY